MWTCRPLPPTDWPALAGFIHRHNRRPDGRPRCLHADQGETEAAHAEELAGLNAAECCFLVAQAGPGTGPWLGWIGAEFDPDAGRAWLRGPLVDPAALGSQAAAALRRHLVQALLVALPAVPRFDAFPSADEAALTEAYGAEGFAALATHRVLRQDGARPPVAMPAPDPAMSDLAINEGPPGPPLREALLSLHGRLFPNSYLPGPALLASLGDDQRLFVARQGDDLLGYVYLQQQRTANQGYIDYLGVQEAAQGRGVGRALLDRALHWARVERGLPAVELTVREDRGNARQLYARAGFHEVAAGLQLSWRR